MIPPLRRERAIHAAAAHRTYLPTLVHKKQLDFPFDSRGNIFSPSGGCSGWSLVFCVGQNYIYAVYCILVGSHAASVSSKRQYSCARKTAHEAVCTVKAKLTRLGLPFKIRDERRVWGNSRARTSQRLTRVICCACSTRAPQSYCQMFHVFKPTRPPQRGDGGRRTAPPPPNHSPDPPPPNDKKRT